MSLHNLLNSELPLNRKERYYTGTIFPMIVWRNNGRHFDRFTALIDGYKPQPIEVAASRSNIQLFTEYGLAESIFGPAHERFPNPPQARDTPDVMILIRGAQKVLIALEAKMFLPPSAADLYNQMTRQAELLNYLEDALHIDSVYHYAILPQQWQDSLYENFEFPVMTWNALFDQYIDHAPEDYHLSILKFALDNWSALVSQGSSSYGANSEDKISGETIYREYKAARLEMNVMGRNGGLYGSLLQADLQLGNWRTQPYEVSSMSEPPNRNWFYISEWIDLIDNQ